MASRLGSPAPSLAAHVPGADIVWIVLDTLRFDVAQAAHEAGETPALSAWLPPGGWEERHAPGSFTYASHHAMFAGFLPTPLDPGPHQRPLALAFAGATTIGEGSLVLDGASVPEGLAALGYRTVCVGGVGFFNPEQPLGRVLPGMFGESHWAPELGVADRASAEHQVSRCVNVVSSTELATPLFLFVNVSALHQPNWFYDPDAEPGVDTLRSHRCALAAVDRALPPLVDALQRRAERRDRPCHVMICSDHGTAYGEDGHMGHRVALPCVWTVPFAEVWVAGRSGAS